jgi:hypothetical protein
MAALFKAAGMRPAGAGNTLHTADIIESSGQSSNAYAILS